MQLSTMAEVARKAIEVVGRGWTQNHSAVNADGKLVEAESPQAEAWCLLGGLYRAYFELYGEVDTIELRPLHERFDAAVYARTKAAYASVTRWNDDSERSVYEVVALLNQVADELAA